MLPPMLTLPEDSGLRARRLTAADAQALQVLLAACDDYHVLVYGRPSIAEDVRELLEDGPPGKSAEDKFVFGLFTPRPRLVGALDMVRDFREPGEWYLGLLMLEPSVRGKGVGETVVRATEDWVRAQGGQRVRLNVAEQNTGAMRFWQRMGFVFDKRFPPRTLGERQTVLLELAHPL
jgi:GNAT superfamily N-acetyltransferase